MTGAVAETTFGLRTSTHDVLIIAVDGQARIWVRKGGVAVMECGELAIPVEGESRGRRPRERRSAWHRVNYWPWSWAGLSGHWGLAGSGL